jgi:outer membrane receptor protein involved in Fe transport
MHDSGKIRLLAGLSHAARQSAGEFRLASPGDPVSTVPFIDNLTKTDEYLYALASPLKSLTITAAATWNRTSSEPSSEHGIDPKLGISWRPTSHTTVRAAAFRSPSSSIANTALNAQPRLEPAQIAGFSQVAFDSIDGRSTARGVAVDHTLSPRLFVGWETLHRDTAVGVLNPLAPPGEQLAEVTFRERTHQGYLYWTPQDRLGFSAKLEHGRYGSSPTVNGVPLFNYSDLTIERLPIELRYFSPTGWVLGFRTSHIKEQGTFVMTTPIPDTLAPGHDRFWLVDAFVSYRLPNRRGLLSLNADNLLDRRFRFQDVIAEDATLIPERLFSFRFTLSFE